MTFAEGVLRLVRAGVRNDHRVEPEAPARAAEGQAEAEIPVAAVIAGNEPVFADIEAAVELVESGLATRVVLTGFPAWPGLLWRTHQLADVADVVIIPTAAREGGRVDLVVMREPPIDG